MATKTSTLFGARLRELRQEANYSQSDLARLARTSKSSINMYERGEREPGFEMMETLADIFNVDMNYLMGQSEKKGRLFDDRGLPPNILPMPKMRKVPLLGTIACGEPILASENISAYLDVAEEIHCDFALRCKGDSMMDARILDGDVVYIRLQPDVENGEIAAVLIDGMETEATLKRVYKSEGQVVLAPANASYTPLAFVGEDLARIHILGKAVAFASLVR